MDILIKTEWLSSTPSIILSIKTSSYAGASKNDTLLGSDYNNKTFNPGSIGEWTHHEYRNVSVAGNMGPVKWASVILIRNSDGKIIGVNQYGEEHRFNDLNTHAMVRFVDYLNYIDNQTL